MRSPITDKHVLQPDQRYSSVLVTKLINQIMKAGKRSLASRIVYTALDASAEKLKKPAMEVLDTAIAKRRAHDGAQEPPRRRFQLPGAN